MKKTDEMSNEELKNLYQEFFLEWEAEWEKENPIQKFKNKRIRDYCKYCDHSASWCGYQEGHDEGVMSLR